MVITDEKIVVTHRMMQNANMTRGEQYGVPVDINEPSKGLRWLNLLDMKGPDFDAIEEYFLNKQKKS